MTEPFPANASSRSGPPRVRAPFAGAAKHAQVAALLEAVAAGDDAALAELHRGTAAQMRAMAYRVLRDRELAEEAVQDAFVQIWRNAATFSGELAAPTTWMLKIVRNRAVDLHRRRERELALRGPSDEEVDYEAIASETPGPEEQASLASELRGLHDVWSGLGESERRALELAFVEERTNVEVAAAMHAPLGTVKSWIHRSLTRLRAAYGRPVEVANARELRSHVPRGDARAAYVRA